MWKPNLHNDNSDINTLMEEVFEMQNFDGSFGDGEKLLYTSYFLIAMVLYKRVKSPFLLIIKRAVNYILYADEHSSIRYLALKLLKEKTSLRSKEIQNKIVSMEYNDKVGNLRYIYHVFLEDIQKFSLIMFNKPLKKLDLINFLFTEINNSSDVI